MDKEPSSRKWQVSSWEAALTYQGISMAMGTGALLSPAMLEAMNEAQDQLEQRHQEKDDHDKRPPKPPRRPNARIGRIALNPS